MSRRLNLLHTNDLHGHFTAAMADELAARKRSLEPCLLLDSGDAVGCGNVGWRVGGEPMHDLFRRAGFDAGALGNREFHFRPGPQRCKLRRAPMPILCANISPAEYGGIRPELVLSPMDGVTVRLFGLLTPMIPPGHWARFISPARFEDPLAAARRVLAAERATVTICLSHLGIRRDRELAAAGLPLDLILGGHSHTGFETPERVDGIPIFQNHPWGVSWTRIALTIDEGRVTDVRSEMIRWEDSPS